MRLMSSYELQRRTEKELSALFARVSKGLVQSPSGSPERRNALGTLENISRARRARLALSGP